MTDGQTQIQTKGGGGGNDDFTTGYGVEFGSSTDEYAGLALVDSGVRSNNRGFIGFRGVASGGQGHSSVSIGVAASTAGGTTEKARVNASDGDFYTNDGSVSSLSDSRLKKNIQDLSDGLSVLNQLKPRTFEYNGSGSMTEDGGDGVTRYGFIADEVLTVAPQYVSTGSEQITDATGSLVRVDDFKTLSTGRMIPMMINAIQELSAEVNNLKAQISGSSDFNALKTAVSVSS